MIAQYLNIDLSQVLDLDKLPQEKRATITSQLEQVLENRVYSEVLLNLSKEDQALLNKILDDDGDVEEFLKSKLPNLDLIIAEVIAGLKKEVLQMMEAVGQARAEAKTSSN